MFLLPFHCDCETYRVFRSLLKRRFFFFFFGVKDIKKALLSEQRPKQPSAATSNYHLIISCAGFHELHRGCKSSDRTSACQAVRLRGAEKRKKPKKREEAGAGAPWGTEHSGIYSWPHKTNKKQNKISRRSHLMENAGEKTEWMTTTSRDREHHTELFRGPGKAAWFQLKSQVLVLLMFFMECCNFRILISVASFIWD